MGDEVAVRSVDCRGLRCDRGFSEIARYTGGRRAPSGETCRTNASWWGELRGREGALTAATCRLMVTISPLCISLLLEKGRVVVARTLLEHGVQ